MENEEIDSPEIIEMRLALDKYCTAHPHDQMKSACVCCHLEIPLSNRRYKLMGNYCGKCSTICENLAKMRGDKKDEYVKTLPHYVNISFYQTEYDVPVEQLV